MLKTRTWIILAIVIALIIAGLIITNYLRTHKTYEEVLSNMISEDEDVEQITIRYCRPDGEEGKDKTMVLTEQDDIAGIMEEPADMELVGTSEKNDTLYVIQYRIDEDRRPYGLELEEQDILVSYGEDVGIEKQYSYDIPGTNKLIEAIEANDDKWEAIDRDTGSKAAGTLYQRCPDDRSE